MKILRMSAENVKRIKAVEITPEGNMVIIGGQNGEGKTSTLDCIMYCLAGNKSICDRPLRDGEKQGAVTLVIDHPKGNMVAKRTFTPNGGSITIANDEGMRYTSPQSILDKITGKLAFDPVEFMRLDRKKQFETLREMVGIDFAVADEKRKKAYDERTIINRQIRTASDKVNELVKYSDAEEPLDVTELLNELTKANEHNQKVERIQQSIVTAEERIAAIETKNNEIADEIKRLREKITANETEIENGREAVQAAKDSMPAPVDVAPLKERINAADGINATWRKHEEYLAAKAEYNKLDDTAKRLTDEVENVDSWKKAQLAAARFPVKGLSFEEETITFNGVPLDQASSAEQLRVSAAMAMAMNPDLRIMLIRDGSLLDDKSLAMLTLIAAENDYQIWLERVGEGEECSVIIEDGMIKAAPEEKTPAVPEPEPEDGSLESNIKTLQEQGDLYEDGNTPGTTA